MEAFVQALEPGMKRASPAGVPWQVGSGEPVFTLKEAVRKHWHHLLVTGSFPTVAFVGGGYYKIPFGFIVPLFFASVIYGQWPVIMKRAPYAFQFVLGAVWLGGGVVAAVVMSVLPAVAPDHP